MLGNGSSNGNGKNGKPSRNGAKSPNGDRFLAQVNDLKKRWASDVRWAGIQRPYSAEDVVKLRGSVNVEHSLARQGAERLWYLLNNRELVRTFGALTGAQAVQMVRGGLEAIYLSG